MTSPQPPLDAALLSFPKSGRTWLKLMLKLYLEEVFLVGEMPLDGHRDWHRAAPGIPTLVVEHDGDPHFKSVDELDRDRSRFAGHRVILLVRDPRDVMVSLFFEMTRRGRFYEGWGFDTSRLPERDDSISSFIGAPSGRLDALLAYYGLWDRARHTVQDFMLVRYEDLHEDAVTTLGQVAVFLGLPVQPRAFSHAVDQCRFDRMRRAESTHGFGSDTLTPGDAADPESFKVRRGKVGGYVDYLSPEDVAYIDRRCEELPDYLACYRSGTRTS